MSSPGKKRVLVVTFSFRPLNNPRAFRWSLLCDRLAAAGLEVDVVTSWVPGSEAVERNQGLTVYRAGNRWIEALRARFRGARAVAGVSAPSGKSSILEQARSGLVRSGLLVWRSLHWPDASCLWYWPARRVVDCLMRASRYDAIIVVAPAYTAVLVGMHAKRRQQDAGLLLDIGDPFSFLAESPPNNTWLYAALNRRMETAALAASSRVSVTNENVKERYAAAFPGIRKRLEVIPPMLSLAPAQGGRPDIFEPGRRNIVYVGTLYRGLREPTFLLALVEQARQLGAMENVDLHFVGDVSACAELIEPHRIASGGNLKVHGLVPRPRVAQIMNSADILINIGNESLTQLPSKVVEYAATGRPVINLAVTSADTSVEFFSRYPPALNIVHEGRPPGVGQVRRFMEFVAAPPASIAPDRIAEFLAPYRPEKILGQYLGILANISAMKAE